MQRRALDDVLEIAQDLADPFQIVQLNCIDQWPVCLGSVPDWEIDKSFPLTLQKSKSNSPLELDGESAD